jgi:hypothetical protein
VASSSSLSPSPNTAYVAQSWSNTIRPLRSKQLSSPSRFGLLPTTTTCTRTKAAASLVTRHETANDDDNDDQVTSFSRRSESPLGVRRRVKAVLAKAKSRTGIRNSSEDENDYYGTRTGTGRNGCLIHVENSKQNNRPRLISLPMPHPLEVLVMDRWNWPWSIRDGHSDRRSRIQHQPFRPSLKTTRIQRRTAGRSAATTTIPEMISRLKSMPFEPMSRLRTRIHFPLHCPIGQIPETTSSGW